MSNIAFEKWSRTKSAKLFLGLASGFVLLAASSQVQAKEQIMQCIQAASQYHRVNPDIMTAIVMVESSMRPNVVNNNKNGTTDYGLTGINSLHIHEGMKLAQYGIRERELSNPCVSIYVGAWHLSRMMQRYGNDWYAIGAYHSVTPQHNQKYQRLVANALQKVRYRQ